jgi:hypothetical protein
MATRPSSLTIFDRATPEQRAEWRVDALSVDCPSCKADAGWPCFSVSEKPCKPHAGRIVNATQLRADKAKGEQP